MSATERQRLIREEIASSVAGMGKADTKSGQQDLGKLIGGAAGALIEANGDNKDALLPRYSQTPHSRDSQAPHTFNTCYRYPVTRAPQ